MFGIFTPIYGPIRDFYVRDYYVQDYCVRDYYIWEKFVAPKKHLLWFFYLNNAVMKKRTQNAGARISEIQKILTSPLLSLFWFWTSAPLDSKIHSESPDSLMLFHQRRPTFKI
jgi:hypothetical protein